VSKAGWRLDFLQLLPGLCLPIPPSPLFSLPSLFSSLPQFSTLLPIKGFSLLWSGALREHCELYQQLRAEPGRQTGFFAAFWVEIPTFLHYTFTGIQV